MNWYSRDEERYVEYGSSFSASRRFGIAQQLTDTVYNMNVEHLPADVPTVFESLDDAGVRTAGHDVPHVPRPPPAPGLARARRSPGWPRPSVRRPVMGPRELFYADIFASRETRLPLAARPAGHPRPARRLRRAPTSSSTTSSTSCCCRCPTTTRTRTSTARTRRSTSIADGRPPARAADARRRRHRRVPRRARGDRRRRPLARAGRAAHRPAATAFDDWPCWRPAARAAPTPRSRVCPAQRAAMVYALVPEGRDDARAAARRRPRWRSTASTSSMWRPAPREGAIARRERGELRFAPGGDVRDERGGALVASRRPSTCCGARVEDGVLRTPRLPRRAGARVGGADLPDVGRRAALGGARLGVPRLGRRRPRRRRQPRLAAPRRLARRAGLLRGRRRPHDHGAWSIADVAPMVRAHFGA